MRAMLLLSVWNCQVKYLCLQKFTVPLLMVLRLNYWRIQAHRDFHSEDLKNQPPIMRSVVGRLSGFNS
jgi:hypothetical protein